MGDIDVCAPEKVPVKSWRVWIECLHLDKLRVYEGPDSDQDVKSQAVGDGDDDKQNMNGDGMSSSGSIGSMLWVKVSDLGWTDNPNTTPTKDYELCEWWCASAVPEGKSLMRKAI